VALFLQAEVLASKLSFAAARQIKLLEAAEPDATAAAGLHSAFEDGCCSEAADAKCSEDARCSVTGNAYSSEVD
jgi:hypothetical protein